MNLENLQKALSEIDKEKLELFKQDIDNFDDIIIIGNGGSNAIAQHIAQDYTKVLNKRALCFADASRLTCYINDYGRDSAYYKFIEDFAKSDTLIILISSSGRSDNIILSAQYCRYNKLNYIILSGFDYDNELRRDFGSDALLDIWVDSKEYGVVELTHEAILHSVC